jgi:hypothetical protein
MIGDGAYESGESVQRAKFNCGSALEHSGALWR